MKCSRCSDEAQFKLVVRAEQETIEKIKELVMRVTGEEELYVCKYHADDLERNAPFFIRNYFKREKLVEGERRVA